MGIVYIQGFDGGVPCGGAGCYPWQVSPLVGTLNTNIGASSVTVRTGTFSIRANPTGAATAAISLGKQDTTNGQQTGFGLSDFYVRTYFRYATKPSAGGNDPLLYFRTAGNALVAAIGINSAGRLSAIGSGVGTTVGTTVLAANTWYRIEAHYIAGITGSLEVKLDGAVEATLTGIFNINSITDFYMGKRLDATSTNLDFFYDDFMVSDSAYPGPGRVIDLRPVGAGTYGDWTAGPAPQDFTQVNFTPLDVNAAGLLYIKNSGGVANQVSTFRVTNPITAGITGKIKAVTPWLFLREDTAGVSNGKIRMRVNGVDFDSLSLDSNTLYNPQGKIYTTNPNTGLNWKRSDLITIEVGPLQANAIAMRCSGVGLTVAYNDEEPGDGQPQISLLGAGS